MNFANKVRTNISYAAARLTHQSKIILSTSLREMDIHPLPTQPSFTSVAPPSRVSYLQLAVFLSVLVLFGIGYRYVERDYKMFLALGPGGTAYSFRGYGQLFFMSFFKVRDPYLAPEMPSRLRPRVGFLKELEARRGDRPQLAGIAPQRQITQNCSDGMRQALQDMIRGLADECPSHWYVATSAFERHNEALFSKFKTFAEPDYYGEIVHSHSDGSMHLALHPADVKLVLEKGWGERHPLARGRTWWWHAPVPRGFMIIYGPRDEAELQQVKSIIRAAAWWVSGVDSRGEKGREHVEHAKISDPPFDVD